MTKYPALFLVYMLAPTGSIFLHCLAPSMEKTTSAVLTISRKVSLPGQLIVEYYDNERKIKRAQYYLVNNKKNGNYLEYYRSGVVKQQTTYINGLKNGKSIEYYDNGDVSMQTDYLKDKTIKRVSYLGHSREISSELRADGTNITYYFNQKFMPLTRDDASFLAMKGIGANGRISGNVAFTTVHGPVQADDFVVNGIPTVQNMEKEAVEKLIDLKREFEASHPDETCCGFVMVVNYSNATLHAVVNPAGEMYTFNPLAGKINYIDYYTKRDNHYYVKVGHQIVE